MWPSSSNSNPLMLLACSVTFPFTTAGSICLRCAVRRTARPVWMRPGMYFRFPCSAGADSAGERHAGGDGACTDGSDGRAALPDLHQATSHALLSLRTGTSGYTSRYSMVGKAALPNLHQAACHALLRLRTGQSVFAGRKLNAGI